MHRLLQYGDITNSRAFPEITGHGGGGQGFPQGLYICSLFFIMTDVGYSFVLFGVLSDEPLGLGMSEDAVENIQ